MAGKLGSTWMSILLSGHGVERYGKTKEGVVSNSDSHGNLNIKIYVNFSKTKSCKTHSLSMFGEA